jgi:GTP-binding protein
LIGFETFLVNTSSGRAVMSHLFESYGPYAGELLTRSSGTLVSMDQGEATAYTLESLQDRGRLFIRPGDIVYEGMIVGENPRLEDIPVNPTKTKKLSNVRSQGEGVGIVLAPPIVMTLEQAIEYIEPDEYVEVTPKSIRLRKRLLKATDRKRQERSMEAANA